MGIPGWALPLAVFAWLLYISMFVRHRSRVEAVRRGAPRPPSTSEAKAAWGMALEWLGIMMIWVFRRPRDVYNPAALPIAGFALIAASIVFSWFALKHLGDQWRLKAEVTSDHRLITTGPYSVVRHPVYAGLLGMILGTGLALTQWWALAAGLALYIAGTEIRVYLEESLLARRFGPEYRSYRSRVSAYIPFVR